MECTNIMLVTAHPDDEAMFFAPTLHKLQQQGTTIHILCLSTGEALSHTRKQDNQTYLWTLLNLRLVCWPAVGNGAGLGRVRSKELLAAARVLQVWGVCNSTNSTANMLYDDG
jgi:LmbE family N-acetylglucosaminyl deacetylase